MTVRWSTPEEAVELVQSGYRIFVQGASAFPQTLVDALTRRWQELTDVEIVHLHTNGSAPYVGEKCAGHFHHRHRSRSPRSTHRCRARWATPLCTRAS